MNSNPQDEIQDEVDVSRRAFLAAAATALAAVGLVGGIAGCGAPDQTSANANGDASQSSTAAVQQITEKLFSVSDAAKLKANEALPFVLPTTNEPGVILRDKSGAWHAMSARCTHVGCVVAWRSDTQKLHCPCHNSNFDQNGKVLGGPAKKPLPLWKAEVQGNNVIVAI